MKLSKRTVIALLCAFCWTMGSDRASAAEINWIEYLQSASVVAAIAAAISFVEGDCSGKLSVREDKHSADDRTLIFECKAGGVGSALKLKKYGNSPWVPDSFHYAG